MITYIEALESYIPKEGELSLFLGGGITDCPDWQKELVDILRAKLDTDLTILNPRRANFPIDDPSASYDQIKWEFDHLRRVDAITFWFPKETLCPITLYELGAWSMTDKPIFVGTDKGYQRSGDVFVQTQLVRPEVVITYDIEQLAMEVIKWAHYPRQKYNTDPIPRVPPAPPLRRVCESVDPEHEAIFKFDNLLRWFGFK
ncbi:MAG TPA: nucleoside 2-deoxyribosyltransferase domain-containing protein [Candidatus Nitrosocosmicus sp.]|nr:nucleoside 2-deoxyribosyltransferase domain-containing protein [Candidatus Nitrosocosmicus sp.]